MPRRPAPCHATPRHATPCHATPCHVLFCHAVPRGAMRFEQKQSMPSNAVLFHVYACADDSPCRAMPCHADNNARNAMQCNAMQCNGMRC
eukprot:11215178-Lingulodinium_polyedra.AAC.1